MNIEDKIIPGLIHHYGACILGIGTVVDDLMKLIKSESIALPEVDPAVNSYLIAIYKERYQLNKQISLPNNRDVELGRLEKKLIERYGILKDATGIIEGHTKLEEALIEANQPEGINEISSKFAEIELPDLLKQGLIVINHLIHSIQKIYSLPEYWAGIPRNSYTESFYQAADIFQEGVVTASQDIEQCLINNKGYSDDVKQDILTKLAGMYESCLKISLIGSDIYKNKNIFENVTSVKQFWNLENYSALFKYA